MLEQLYLCSLKFSFHSLTLLLWVFTASERSISYKNILQEHVQKSRISELPRYETERTEDGFISTVIIRVSTDKTQRFQGLPHANKKSAEQESAKKACLELKLVT